MADALFYLWTREAVMLLFALCVVAFVLFVFALLGFIVCAAIVYEGMMERRRA